ncbi:MAG: GNAT family N-acetyltransferase [Anaerolineales bacterium]|nr:GNAT family N-acetyltransferase [Anaerolineales bacterium]
MEITCLHQHQIKKASEVLAASFFDYPMFTFYFPDENRRKHYLPWYFRNILNTAYRYGEIYTTADVSGVIFTLPPDHNQITLWEYVQNGFLLTPLILGFRNYVRSMECEQFVDETRAKLLKLRPHYYLWGLGVDPNQKKTGIGATLLQLILEKADRENTAIYLETHSENNVPYYEKYKFDLLHTAKIPKHNLPFWCMLREPG